MSRIGRISLKIPAGVVFEVGQKEVIATGSKGVLKNTLPNGFNVVVDGASINVVVQGAVKTSELDKKTSSLYGTLCRNISNMLYGVAQGFEKKLELVGVGYKADLQNNSVLKLSLGYSHDILYQIPEGITIQMEKPTAFKILGANKQKVGQTASEIIRYRPPEPYKGKGVRVPGQFLRMKEGKSK
jgi:large subunit ribosomal protein L6